MDPYFFDQRQMSVVLHPTSLPGRFGIGDVGAEARHFVDWLASAGVKVWHVLPLSPPGGPNDDIPYASWASLAGNPQLISLEELVHLGLVDAWDLDSIHFPEGWVSNPEALRVKQERLGWAATRFLADSHHPLRPEFAKFREEASWAVEAARFAARKERARGKPWWSWEKILKDRTPASLARVDAELREPIEHALVCFFLFERQWEALKWYAGERNVRFLGDIPIYVQVDSSDVWSYPEGFRIDEKGRMEAQSGTPPDAFSDDGQLWGGPLYDWAVMARDDYAWWRLRLERALHHVDAIRIDHFRAFSAFWEVPGDAATAKEGRWVEGPGLHFFETVERHMGKLPLCAEDLGYIDQAVKDLLEATQMPGMKILHYAFGEDAGNPYLPHNIPFNAIVYPGNHDNDTTVGWWKKLPEHVRTHVQHYLGRHGDDISWDLIRVALASPARLAAIQMQDLLSLDDWARMNDPAGYSGPPETWSNWRWRLHPGEARGDIAERMRFLGTLYGRC